MAKDRASIDQPRHLGLCGIAVPVLFTVGVWWAGSLWDGYSHATQPISDLGGAVGPQPVIQNINFYVVGVLITAFAFGLARSIGDERGAGAGPVLIGSLGLGVASMPAVPCLSLGCEEPTFTDVTHLLVINAGILAFIVGALLLARRIRAHPQWGSFSGYTALTGIATLVAWAAVIAAVGVDPEALRLGALQRVMVGIAFLWIGVAGLRILLTSRSVAAAGVEQRSGA